ncbi:hypothetical protein B9479_002839 [Cryptococcus floricola]|uniref:PQ-loop repeat-containing protein 1 n=1 Tax=Cryptococcus floricola TaxID=2591691 RepID=A0A5D3B2K0_9TREE|nr:hypothetical protein B9479_002839 [Cryptococcus floricola]
MTIVATLASIGMAVGPPLVYADQAYSIVKKKDSSGFSHDVCGVVIIANIIRIFFWLGERFETPLLIQSILLILSQLGLLAICLHYSPSARSQESESYTPIDPSNHDPDQSLEEIEHTEGPSSFAPHQHPLNEGGLKNMWRGLKAGNRPFGFWQWEGFGSYLEFLAGMIVVLGILQVILGRWMWYIDTIGLIALTIESTLPIPQFISNYRNKSCYGFRESALAGWIFGDSFKTVYFFLRGNPIQFKITAIMLVCWDFAVLAQRIKYGSKPPQSHQGGVEFDANAEHQHQDQDEESRGLRDGSER